MEFLRGMKCRIICDSNKLVPPVAVTSNVCLKCELLEKKGTSKPQTTI